MRVLHLLSSTSFHGAETMAAGLVRELAALGVEVDVGILDNGGSADRQIFAATAGAARETVVIPCRGRLDPSTAAHLRRHIERRGIDVLHSHKYKATFYGLLARRGAGRRLRVVATFHNWLHDTLALRLYAAVDQLLARYCDAAVAVSGPIEATLRRRVDPARVWRIGNGVDLERYRPLEPQARERLRAQLGWEGRRVLGFAGRLVPDKGIRFLLQALAQLPAQDGAPWHLALAGEGEDRAAIEADLQARGLAQRASLLGNRSDLAQLYGAFDAFVLPSLVEAFPMVVVEAMGAGLPVIASDVGDVRHIVAEGATGWIVPPRDADALARALRAWLDAGPERLRDMGAAARARALGEFSSRRMAQRYLEVYERVLAA